MKLTTSNATVTNTVVSSKLTIGNNAVVESLTVGNVSINSSAIAVGNVSITPAAISTPSLILGGSAFSGGLFGGIVDYQEFTANGTWYNPYANASANAFLTGYEQVFVMAWGGGGGATSNNTIARGGGGGACALGYYTLANLSNTVTVTIGGGGTSARTTTAALSTAVNGGNTSFGSLIAYGGGGGGPSLGGGGGGILGSGTTAGIGGSPLGGTEGFSSLGGVSTFGGGGSSQANSGGASIFGGGGAGNSGGGSSVYGGGAGTLSANTGTSILGGSGGSLGTSGAIPGGGGSSNTSSANTGARGEVRVWVIGPGSTTAGEPTYALTANTTTLYEGSDVLYTVSTTNVANNTTLYYTLNNSSTATSADFTTAVNGSVIITSGTGTFTLTAADDADGANEAFQIDVRTGSESGTIVASNGSVSIVPLVTGTYNGFAELSSNTWSSAPIGTANSNRSVIVVIYQRVANSGINTASGVTIGGVSATLLVSRNDDDRGHVDIWGANVPTGTTANIDILWNNQGGNGKVAASYALYGANLTPYSTGSNRTGSSSISANVNVINGGFVIAGLGADSPGGGSTTTFNSGVTTDNNGSTLDIGAFGWGSQSTTLTQTDYTVSGTTNGGGDTLLAVASFQPG